ncbi:hypothetical protein BM531_20425, partial [Clostridioides difficile]
RIRKTNGMALQYVNKQTDKICIEAVKQDGRSIQFVNNKTEEICINAIRYLNKNIILKMY